MKSLKNKDGPLIAVLYGTMTTTPIADSRCFHLGYALLCLVLLLVFQSLKLALVRTLAWRNSSTSNAAPVVRIFTP